jgi:N utilization substance protein B
MLNRRLIRIRAMQALYAYEQSRKANFLLAQDIIRERFMPDLNSMEKQDKTKLAGMTSLGIQMLEEKFAVIKTKEDFEAPPAIEKVVRDASGIYVVNNRNDRQQMALRILKDADKVFDVYFKLLSLYLALADLAEKDKEHEGKSRLGDLRLLKELRIHPEYELGILKRSAKWDDEQEIVRDIYRKVLKVNSKYIEYCSKINHTIEEEINLIKYLVKNIFIKSPESVAYFERFHLYWPEDKETLRSMVARTFQDYEENGKLSIAEPDEEWEERKDFLKILFTKTIEDEDELMELILPNLRNWEYERVADTDKILLKMALTEMTEFSSIPVKVTINEIIEIAKNYSTPKSSLFINGILDRLSKDLTSSGKIRKSGRGMLDNK